MEKLLPQNIEAEAGVLGSIIIDPEAIVQVADFLVAGDFYRDAHRTIYEVILELYEEHAPADFITICDELDRRKKLEGVGGHSYITSLVNQVPTSGNVEFYGRIVERTAILRKLIHGAGQIAAIAYEEGDADVALDKAEQLIFDIGQKKEQSGLTDLSEIMMDCLKDLDHAHENRHAVIGVPTGYTDMDAMYGNLQPSDLILLAGRPGIGKTALGMNIAYRAACRGKRVAVFSLEMGKKQLGYRLISMLTGIPTQRLRNGWIDDGEWDKIIAAQDHLSTLPISIDDASDTPVISIKSKVRRKQIETGQKVDLIAVDYLGLMETPETDHHYENRVQEITKISRGLKRLAKEFDVPVLAMAQLSRKVEERQSKIPQLSDLRDSGCLAGDTMIYLPDEGAYKRIDSLIGQRDFNVLALNEQTWKLEVGKATNAFSTGHKSVYKMITRLGRTVRATSTHKFLTIDGWKALGELAPKMHIALPRQLEGLTQATMSNAELALLGHLIGDGCTLPRHVIQYTTVDHDLAEIVANLAIEVFGKDIAPRINWESRKDEKGGWYQVYLASGFRLARGKYNPVAQWLRGMDAYGFRSYEKFVPAKVFAQSNEGIATFLCHLWATDGTAFCTERRNIPTISYATSSHQLAYDVQALLLRLAILARVSCVPQGSKGRHQYHVDISGKTNQERFITLVGIAGKRKNVLLDQVRSHLSTRIGNTNLDIIPSAIWRYMVVPAMIAAKITARQMYAGIGTAYAGTSMYKQGMGRERALRVATVVNSEQLTLLAQSDVYWDEIVSIEPDGEEEVYDLTVDEHHNFVADNIIVHNSLEQDSDIVMFVYRDDYYAGVDERGRSKSNRPGIADIIVAKHRNGDVGGFSLRFVGKRTSFYNMDETVED